MITIRKSKDRGHANHGWLDTYHTFSFADYYDPAHESFRSLRVINEDRVAPGRGFGMHPHNDMEIVTIVLEGQLAHRDSLGTGSVIRPGDLQRMSAGTGIEHSEFNPSETQHVHLYQIWLKPSARGLMPSYEQKAFDENSRVNALQLVASPDGANGSLTIHQDARLYLSVIENGRTLPYAVQPGRAAWLQVLRGALDLNGIRLNEGDGAAIEKEREVALMGAHDAEVLLFDLA
ncbi:MAG TPA: pirin family protein [Planctomycetota bacterium]|nr:pirin family protein [Planctomycetota bacterium]